MPLTAQAARVLSQIVELLDVLPFEDARLTMKILQDSPYVTPRRPHRNTLHVNFNGASNGASKGTSSATSSSPSSSPSGLFEGPSEVLQSFFLQFWAEYPRKQDKQETLKIYNKLSPDKKLQDRILQALHVAKASEPWGRDEGRFIPLPSTWLRRRRFDDEGLEASHLKSQAQRLWDEAQEEKRSTRQGAAR